MIRLSAIGFWFVCTGALIAADAPVQPPPASEPVFLTVWNGALVVLVPLVIHQLKIRLAGWPKVVWPALAVVFGMAGDWFMAKFGLIPDSSFGLGALCGASGVALRELSKQALVTACSTVSSKDEPKPPVPPAPPS